MHKETNSKPLTYMSGFYNEHESEAVAGALPHGCFSPQQVPFGLYAEKFSSTAFTAPRNQNRRNWFYRILPSVIQGSYQPRKLGAICSAPLPEHCVVPDMLRWDAFEIPTGATDFVDGIVSVAACGEARAGVGMAIHLYLANRSMEDRFFYNADGEMLVIPQQGGLRLHTECGILALCPGEIGLIPRGMKFRVVLGESTARGWICENYGAPFILPERGPVGSDGYSNDRDFLFPVAAYEERSGDFELLCKFGGRLFAAAMTHSPLDVVAWIGNSAPWKYDLLRFNTINTVSYDHPDPSIFTVLTSPSDTPGVANADFVIFPPRWMVAESTFRPPWYHRNIMNEYMGLIYGIYDAKEEGFVPGGSSLHNCMSPHGPEAAVYEKATTAALQPQKQEETMAFMLESRHLIIPTEAALKSPYLQSDYNACWSGLKRNFAVGEKLR